MDARKKRQLIILAVAAAVFAVAFVIWTKSTVPEDEPIVTPGASSLNSAQPTRSGSELIYPAPKVFPLNTSFDTPVIGQLKTFQNFQASKLVEGELGRENPFNNY